ncbi:MAG: hypothetical protein WB588_00210 [Dehalococcoidia bacterium]
MQRRFSTRLNRISFLILILILSLVLSGLPSCSPPPVFNYFNASPTTITSGQAVTLTWDVSGARRANISGVGDVYPSGNAIVVPSSTTTYVLTVPDSKQSLSVTITVNPAADLSEIQTPDTNVPAPASSVADNSSSAMITLRYDNLGSSSNDYLSNQIAVWHTYAKLPSATSVASAGYSVDVLRGFTSSSATGIPVKSPLIILPLGDGMVCIVRNYAGLTYKYYKLGTTWYNDQLDEADRLKAPGWGLMTTFSPAQTPFKIQKLDIAGVANITGSPDEYNSQLFVVRILDDNGHEIWTKSLPWSTFRSDSSDKVPKAVWRSIDVEDVLVTGDFSVEFLTESNECTTEKSPSYNYLALAYEKIVGKDVNTRSMISDDGAKPDSWVRLYSPYGSPIPFNLCIRVDGSYPNK